MIARFRERLRDAAVALHPFHHEKVRDLVVHAWRERIGLAIDQAAAYFPNMKGGATADARTASAARLRGISGAFLLTLLLLFSGGLVLFGWWTHRACVATEYRKLGGEAARASSELAIPLSAAADHVISLRYIAETAYLYPTWNREALSRLRSWSEGDDGYLGGLTPVESRAYSGIVGLMSPGMQDAESPDLISAAALLPALANTRRQHSEFSWVLFMSAREDLIAVTPWTSRRASMELFGAETFPAVMARAMAYNAPNQIRPFNATSAPSRRGRWTDFYIDPVDRQPKATYVEPVYLHDEFRGVVTADLNIAELSQILARHRTPLAVHVVADRRGRVMVTADGSAITDQPDPDLRTVVAERDGRSPGETSHGGSRYLISRIDETPWFLVSRANPRALNAECFASNRSVYLMLLVALAGTAASLWMFRWLFLNPALQLLRVLNETAEGWTPSVPRMPVFWRSWFALLMRGVHERAALGEQVRHEKSRLATLLECLGDGVVATDLAGVVTHINPAAARLLGQSAPDVIGRDLADVLGRFRRRDGEPDDGAVGEVSSIVTEILSSTKPALSLGVLRSDVQDSRGRRQEQLVTGSGAPLRSEDGSRLGTVLVLQDVTERRRLEAMLRESQKMESVGQLAGGIAHDVNNMLTVIRGSADLLRNPGVLDHEGESITQDIIRACDEATSLIRDLLSFSRRGQGLSVPVNVHEVLLKTEALLRRALDRRIAIEVSLAATKTTVVGDPVQLQNAFLNIGVNARDAMPSGGTLRIETSNTVLDALACVSDTFNLAPGAYIQISIQDTGTGIPPQILDRIFEPFFSTKEANKGTGLGLASVYGCMQDHHGSVTVNSAVGEGSVFQLLLPLAAPQGPVVTSSGALPVTTLPGGIGVLLVDDEDLVRNTARRMLERAGCKVFAAAGGAEAIQIYRRHQQDISVVILDAVMPETSGLETFAALKRLNPAVVGIIASGFIRSKIKAEGLGISGFIQKPFTMEQLCRAISEAMVQPSAPHGG